MTGKDMELSGNESQSKEDSGVTSRPVEMAQWAECLLYMREDLSSDAQPPGKS